MEVLNLKENDLLCEEKESIFVPIDEATIWRQFLCHYPLSAGKASPRGKKLMIQ